jgi:hypothetical protein
MSQTALSTHKDRWRGVRNPRERHSPHSPPPRPQGRLADLCHRGGGQLLRHVLCGQDFLLAERTARSARLPTLSADEPPVDARGMKLVGAWELAQLVASCEGAEAHRALVLTTGCSLRRCAIGRCGLPTVPPVPRRRSTLGARSIGARGKLAHDCKLNRAKALCLLVHELPLLPRSTPALIDHHGAPKEEGNEE